jgi:hypothetical protein
MSKMNTPSSPQLNRMAVVLGGAVLAGGLLHSLDAGAAYSGTTFQSIAVAGSFVPNDFPPSQSIFGSYWFRETPTRMSLRANAAGCGTWFYGGVAFPAQRWQASTTINPNARIFGADGLFCNRPQACAIVTTYWSSGALAAQTNWACTAGTTMSLQGVGWPAITLPGGAGVVFDIGAMAGDGSAPDTAGADLVSGIWVANGG